MYYAAANLDQLLNGGRENLVDGWHSWIPDIEDTISATYECFIDGTTQVRSTEKEQVLVSSKRVKIYCNCNTKQYQKYTASTSIKEG